jgi:hypothetical protein
MVRHSVYLSADEVVFVFEGQQVEWVVDDQSTARSTRELARPHALARDRRGIAAGRPRAFG